MKRPLALLGAAAFAFLTIASYCGEKAAEIILPGCAGLGFCALFALIIAKICNKQKKKLLGEKRPRAFSVLAASAAVLLTGAVCMLRFIHASQPMKSIGMLDGVKAQVRGTILDYPIEQYHRAYYKIRVEHVSVDGKAAALPTFTARLSTQSPISCEPYDTVDCTVKFLEFDRAVGLYSSRNSYLADGIAIGGYIADYGSVTVMPNAAASPGELLVRWRHILARSIEKRLPAREAGLIRAVLLGEKEQINSRDYANFRKIGAAHILVISGLHMTALAACFTFLFSLLRLRPAVRNLFTAAIIILFLAVIGFPVSSVRAAIMYIVMLLGGCLGRRADGVNSLGLAVLLICLENPFSGGDLGFLLSASATLGILVFADGTITRFNGHLPKGKIFGKILKPAASSLAMTFSSAAFTVPIQAVVFGGVSLLAPLAGLVLIFPCTVLLYVSLGAAFFGVFPALSFLAEPFALCAGWIAKFSLVAAEQLAGISGTYLQLSNGLWLAVLTGWALLATILLFTKKRTATCAVLVGAVLLFCCGRIPESNTEIITVAAVKDSSCVVMIKGRRAAVLSLGGFKTNAAEDILLQNNIEEVELLCMPVRDPDAREAAVNIMQSVPVRRLALPMDAYVGRDLILAGEKAARSYLQEGEAIEAFDEIDITARDGMARLSAQIYGVSVVVETDSTGTGACDLLFTTQAASCINSAFTVLQNSDIIDELRTAEQMPLASGRYLLPGGNGLYCDIYRDGSVSFRGESTCLK